MRQRGRQGDFERWYADCYVLVDTGQFGAEGCVLVDNWLCSNPPYPREVEKCGRVVYGDLKREKRYHIYLYEWHVGRRVR